MPARIASRGARTAHQMPGRRLVATPGTEPQRVGDDCGASRTYDAHHLVSKRPWIRHMLEHV